MASSPMKARRELAVESALPLHRSGSPMCCSIAAPISRVTHDGGERFIVGLREREAFVDASVEGAAEVRYRGKKRTYCDAPITSSDDPD